MDLCEVAVLPLPHAQALICLPIPIVEVRSVSGLQKRGQPIIIAAIMQHAKCLSDFCNSKKHQPLICGTAQTIVSRLAVGKVDAFTRICLFEQTPSHHIKELNF